MKKIYYLLLGMGLMIGGSVLAAPYYNYSRTILPQTNNGEDLGTSTQAWRNIYTNNEYLYGVSDGCLFTSSNQVSSTGSPCGSGGGNSFPFPFTQTTYGVSTSTTVGFTGGFLSTASSTINSNLWLANLSQGSAYIGSNGLVQSTATTSVSCSGSASCTPFTVFGASPITISASGSGGGSGNVSTSTNESAGTIAYWTSNSATPALLGKVSTTSLGLTAPITFTGTLGAQIGGVAGSFGCTTASSGVTGCLSGTDWNTFNNKGSGTVTSVTATYPIISTGGNTPVISTGFGTSTTIGVGNDSILYTSHTGVILAVASSSLSLPNTALQNSTISGVALGGTLNNLSHDTSLSGTSYNGSASVSDWGLNLGHTNTWTILQNFNYSSTTGYASFANASSTLFSVGTLNVATSTAGCLQTSSTGVVYVASCSAGGGVTSITAGTGLTGGVITTTGTIALDLTHANTWTGLQQFNANASSTAFSSNSAQFGATGTTTITTAGFLGVASSSPQATLSVGSGIASSSISVAEYAYGATGNNATSTAATLSPRTANTIDWPIGTSATTLTLCNFQPGDHLLVRVSNPNGTAGALTWSVCSGSQLYWVNSTTPTQTTTANQWDIWSFTANSSTGSSTKAVIISGAISPNF